MFDWLLGKKKKKGRRAAARGRSRATTRPSTPAPAPAPQPAPRPAPRVGPASPRVPAASAGSGILRTADDVLAELEAEPTSLRAQRAETPLPPGPVDVNLARHLLAEGPVTREFIQQQIAISGKANSYLCRLLARVPAPPEDALFRLLAANYTVPQVDLKQCRVPVAVARSVSLELVRRYRMVPIDRIGDLLCVVFAGEVNPKGTEAIRRATGLRVKALQCPPQYINILLAKLLHERPPAPRVVAAVPITEAEYKHATQSPEERWESIHVSEGPVRALRTA